MWLRLQGNYINYKSQNIQKHSPIIIDFDFFIWYYKNNKLSKCLTINNEGFPKNEKRT